MTDAYINYDEKFEVAWENGAKLYRFLNDKTSTLRQNIFVAIDKSRNYITLFVQFISEHLQESQEKLIDYVREHYENVQVFVHQNWLRLDFNNDGHVSREDFKKSLTELYEFLKNFEYYEKAVEIKSALYQEAIKYMQKDLENDQKKRESNADENDQKVEKLLEQD